MPERPIDLLPSTTDPTVKTSGRWKFNPHRFFVDATIRRCGDWICVPEWMAHHGLALPQEWLDGAQAPLDAAFTEGKIAEYLAAADGRGEPIRFNPPKPYGVGWVYQTIKGKAPLQVNADVREFFEELTPGSRWLLYEADVLYRNDPQRSHMVVRRHPTLGVRFAMALCDPRRS